MSIGTFGVAADIDLDGVLEVVVGNALYSPTGESIWYNCEEDGFVAVGNFDDDGEPEIGVSGKTEYMVLDTDGSILWTKTIVDHTSGYTASSVFDFEGDGKAEVVYADEQNVWVFDGATGDVKLKMEEHYSVTCTEYPTIADVDGDVQTEIIYTSSEEAWFGTGYEEGVRVIGNRNDTWKPAHTIWNQHSYSITNVENSSGKIPTYPDPNWSSYNNFRSGDLEAGTNTLFTDAVPVAGDICVDECDQDILWIVFHIGNSGTTELPSGVPASLYAKQGQSWVLLETSESTRAIAPGESDEGILFTVNKNDIPEGELLFVVDDFDGTESIIECNEENNQLHVLDVECP